LAIPLTLTSSYWAQRFGSSLEDVVDVRAVHCELIERVVERPCFLIHELEHSFVDLFVCSQELGERRTPQSEVVLILLCIHLHQFRVQEFIVRQMALMVQSVGVLPHL
jgi:hypothetical protein